jgi:hypothetical protein
MTQQPAATTASTAYDWYAWHRTYDVPGSIMQRRLTSVRGHLRDALDQLPPGPIRLISICAGQSRDITGALEGHPRATDVSGRLVELDPRNNEVAEHALAAIGAGARIEVVTGDASTTDAYFGVAPAHIVLVCGVFGNISDADIERTIGLLPSLGADGARVIWTRGRLETDANPTIRGWFAEYGFTENTHEYIGGTMGVGVHRLDGPTSPFPDDASLFEFVGADVLRARSPR